MAGTNKRVCDEFNLLSHTRRGFAGADHQRAALRRRRQERGGVARRQRARHRGVVQRAQLCFLLQPMVDRIVGMVVDEALDDVLDFLTERLLPTNGS